MSVSPVPLGSCGVGEGSRAPSLSDSALEVCLRRAPGPCRVEGGGPAHPPACGAIPEREEGPPWVRFLLGPLFSLEDRSPRALAPTAPSPGSAGGRPDKQASQRRH